MERKEIRIAGFGGQGVVLSGSIVGKAASLFSNSYAALTQSYGPEARGGASRSEVIVVLNKDPHNSRNNPINHHWDNSPLQNKSFLIVDAQNRANCNDIIDAHHISHGRSGRLK